MPRINSILVVVGWAIYRVGAMLWTAYRLVLHQLGIQELKTRPRGGIGEDSAGL